MPVVEPHLCKDFITLLGTQATLRTRYLQRLKVDRGDLFGKAERRLCPGYGPFDHLDKRGVSFAQGQCEYVLRLYHILKVDPSIFFRTSSFGFRISNPLD